MILFENVIQVLYGSVSTALAQRPFLLNCQRSRNCKSATGQC
jgi:hypothetical protein